MKLLKTREVAAITGVPESTLRWTRPLLGEVAGPGAVR